MTTPSGTCSPWATEADLCAPCTGVGAVVPTETDFQISSDILFELSGRQFPGECEKTFRPCSRPAIDEGFPIGWTGWSGQLYGGNGSFSGQGYSGAGYLSGGWGFCGCNREERTGGNSIPSVTLGVNPLVSITEIKIDGAVLDPSKYVIHDWKYLVRTDGNGWPCCQRMWLPDTELGTFSVKAKYGRNPPPAGVRAASVFACQIAIACGSTPSDCELPDRTTQVIRQGVSLNLVDPQQLLKDGRLGQMVIDTFLSTYNPHGLRRRAGVLTPDRAPAAHRTTWSAP